MKAFGMCIDKRVVVGLIAAAGLIWWVAPDLFLTSLPFLLIALCPLSMLLMMKMMNNQGSDAQAQARPQADAAPTAAPAAAPKPRIDAATAAAADVDARRN